jgi:DNA-binding beta-propeller fold protein YncE
MKKLIITAIIAVSVISCQKEIKPKSWQLTESILVEGVNPIGITKTDDGLWLSDGDKNRVVQIGSKGEVIKSLSMFDRPMHIDSEGNTLYVPEYGKDVVTTVDSKGIFQLEPNDSLDAPAGVSVFGQEKAIADFYNNRILYTQDGENWTSFGKKGKADGEFFYPTDVQITESRIWVADAYNNRIQAFDKKMNFIQTIGQDQKMNAATGIYVTDQELFVTDFENDRILIFDLDGTLKQELHEKIEKPTDALVIDGKLHVINYRNSLLNIFEYKEEEHVHAEGDHNDNND